MQEHFQSLPGGPIPWTGIIFSFGIATFWVLVWHLRGQRRLKRLEMIHEERMKAMEKGIPMPELPKFPETTEDGPTATQLEIIKALSASGPANPRWALGVGLIFILLGMGVSLAYYLAGDAELARTAQVGRVWPFGLIGVAAGLGFILHYFIVRGPQE